MQNYMNDASVSILAPLMAMSPTRRYLDYANLALRIGNGALPHAGGIAYKGKVSVSVDASIDSTGTDAGATVAASDDDDGDGDGDPDSDRRKLSKQLTSRSGTKSPATKSLNTEYKRREALEIKMTSAIHLPKTGFFRLPVVLNTIPVSKSTWWAGIKSGKYPAGVKLSERVTAWRAEDIHALIDQLSSNVS